jgi:hypothetical protein
LEPSIANATEGSFFAEPIYHSFLGEPSRALPGYRVIHLEVEMTMMRMTLFAACFAAMAGLAGCGSTPGQRALSGGAIGAGGGALLGAAAGFNPLAGAVIGGAGGAVVGGTTK